MASREDVRAATWWLMRRLELDSMAARLDALAFDAVGDAEWRFRLDVARRAVAGVVQLCDGRATTRVPDELERRQLREDLHARWLR